MSNIFDFYKNKKVFLTGHSGFKGSWLNLWLEILGAEVLGYSLKPNTTPSLSTILNQNNGIFADILDYEKLENIIYGFKPDIVFHLAAQPLVRTSYEEPLLTYKTNVIGTLNVLEASRKCSSVKAFVNVTTDKCYENKEQNVSYKEEDPMGGYDMYSSSKGCVETMSSSYRRSFLSDSGYALATARAGNVIGGGDWAKDRLIPDCIRAIFSNNDIVIRNPDAIRPWQHVLEALYGYLILAQKLYQNKDKYSQAFNFGPDKGNEICVKDVCELVCKYLNKGKIVLDKTNNPHEAKLLMLDNKKAKEYLNWRPKYSSKTAIEKTLIWYKKYHEGEDMKIFSKRQIEEYMNEQAS